MSLDSFFTNLFSGADPARSARLRGGLVGAAQAISQPYANIGSALVGGAQGSQQARQDYGQQQFQDLRLKQLQESLVQDQAKRAALNNLFRMGGQQQPQPGAIQSAPQAGIAPAAPLQAETPPMAGPSVPPPQAVPPQASAPQFHLPAGFESPEQFQSYAAIDPEGAIKRMFPEPEHGLQSFAAGSHVFDKGTNKEVFAVPEKPNPNQPFNTDGTPNAAYQAYERQKAAAAQAPQWANVAIARQNAANRTANGFTDTEGALMGALAERGVSLPAGMRSKEQQKTLYSGILARNPDKSPDEIADLIKKGQIELGAQKKETQTAAAVAGKVEVFQNEIEEFAPLVREALAKVPRGQFVPLNRLLQTADTSISDPNLKVLKGRINALLNAYDGLASRGGTDVDKRAEARALLTSADGPEAANAQLDSFLAEAAAAHRAAVKATKVPELSATDVPAPKSQMLPKPKSPADAQKLKPGTHFLDGNGVERIR